MTTPFDRSFRSFQWFRSTGRGISVISGILAVAFSAGTASGQFDDFDDGNDAGWTHYDPLGGLGAGPQVTYTFPNGGYGIEATTSPSPAEAGPARGASLRQDKVWGNFCISVDILSIGQGEEPAIGLLAGVQPDPGLGATDGYAFTLQPVANDIQLSLVVGEQADGIADAVDLSVPFDPNRSYRLVLARNGDFLRGAVYDLDDLLTPLAVTEGFDATYAGGTAGMLVFDGSGDGISVASAVFDNYVATDGTPPPLSIELSDDNEVSLEWPDSALCHVLQHSATLQTGSWTAVDPTGKLFHVGGEFLFFVGIPEAPAALSDNFRLVFREAP